MLEITTTGFSSIAVRYAGAGPRLAQRIRTALGDIGAHLHENVNTRQIAEGGVIRSGTAALRRSTFSRVDIDGAEMVLRVGFNRTLAKYGRIQEYGGTVTARNGANLTIPLDAARLPTGAPRQGITARALIANPQAFGYTRCFTAKQIIFGVKGKRDPKAVPLFLLRHSVRLPARAPLRTALRELSPYIQRKLEAVRTDTAQDLNGNGTGSQAHED